MNGNAGIAAAGFDQIVASLTIVGLKPETFYGLHFSSQVGRNQGDTVCLIETLRATAQGLGRCSGVEVSGVPSVPGSDVRNSSSLKTRPLRRSTIRQPLSSADCRAG